MQVPHRYIDYHELLDDSAVEAVYLATSPDGRLQQVLDTLNAGKHVLVQKPHAIVRLRFWKWKQPHNNPANAPILLFYAPLPE